MVEDWRRDLRGRIDTLGDQSLTQHPGCLVNGFDGNIWCASWDGDWKQFPV
ncbi:MAG: hypothetical protein IPN47_10680 [Gemmatimonadetes bacterium]|nr:hypothetical protein [Gemmatimonadota bacterium]